MKLQLCFIFGTCKELVEITGPNSNNVTITGLKKHC